VFPIVEPKIVQVKELNSKISNYVQAVKQTEIDKKFKQMKD